MAFNWWPGRQSGNSPAAPQSQTTTVNLANDVVAHVGAHRVGPPAKPLRCWTYTTAGLARFGQKELAVVIDAAAPEAPRPPLMLLDAVARLAAEGKIVDVGGFTEFGPNSKKLLAKSGSLELHGVGYAPGHDLNHIRPMGSPEIEYLAVVQLSKNELESSKFFGLARTLALLAQHYRYYPYPVWNDPHRPEVISRDFLNQSLLRQMSGGVSKPDVMPYSEKQRVVLQISKISARFLAGGLAACIQNQRGLFLPATAGWKESQACLVWKPGQRGPTAVAPPATAPADVTVPFDRVNGRTLGCFIAFLIGASEEGALLLEDGFTVAMNAETGKRLVTALAEGNTFALTGAARLMPFELVMHD